MCKTFKITILLWGVLFFPWNSSFAFEVPDGLIYITEDFAPYNYIENGELKGISVDLLKMIWKELGIESQHISVYPWKRAYTMLQYRKNVVLFTTAKTEDRANLFKWVGPISVNTRTVLISLVKNEYSLRSIDEIRNYKIGIVRGDAAEQVLLSSGSFIKDQMFPVSTLDQNIKKMNLGRIDLIAFNEYSFFKILNAKGINRDNYETVYVANETMACYAFNKEIPDNVVLRFQEALDKIRQGTDYQKLMELYFP